ncbi:MAG: hypothetical protein K9M07_00810 [Simkaniaceae bacterium]|nr:hypothetical protein [Simkaniaceae bacterium]
MEKTSTDVLIIFLSVLFLLFRFIFRKKKQGNAPPILPRVHSEPIPSKKRSPGVVKVNNLPQQYEKTGEEKKETNLRPHPQVETKHSLHRKRKSHFKDALRNPSSLVIANAILNRPYQRPDIQREIDGK